MSFDTSDLEGNRTIRVTADPNEAIKETDESDNYAERTLRFSSSAQGNGQGTDSESLAASTGAENPRRGSKSCSER